jgi:hypothetical protein
MTTSTAFHHATEAHAYISGDTEWLQIVSKDGSYVSVFMPIDVATAMADAFNAAMQPEPTPDTFDDALATKLDREASYADDMRAAGRGELLG